MKTGSLQLFISTVAAQANRALEPLDIKVRFDQRTRWHFGPAGYCWLEFQVLEETPQHETSFAKDAIGVTREETTRDWFARFALRTTTLAIKYWGNRQEQRRMDAERAFDAALEAAGKL